MSDIAQDLGGVVRLLVPEPKPLPDLLLATYHESRGWNACRDAMLKLISAHSAEIAGALRDAERWQPIESAPDDIGLCVVYTPDQGDGERFDIDWKEDGVWHEHYNQFEHFMAVGGVNACGPDVVCSGPGERPDYTHYRKLTAPQAAMGAVGAGDHTSDCRSHDDASVCDCGLLQQR